MQDAQSLPVELEAAEINAVSGGDGRFGLTHYPPESPPCLVPPPTDN